MAKHQKEIFAHRNKYEGNVFKRFGRWFTKLKGWQKGLFILLIALVIAGIIVVGYVYGKLNQVKKVEVDETKLSCVDVDGYINILLLGVDSRDMDNIKGSGADAIMILSIKEETGDVKLMSVYRDTYLKMGDTSTYTKITDSCRLGGPEMTMKSLNQAMDLNLKQFVVVNFKSVADLVDAVGGITVDVQQEEIQQLNKYTIQTAHNIGQKKYNLVKEPGKQKLQGVQAVSYGRIRKGVGDDYKRTERMRIVLTKVFNKLKKSSVSDIDKILDMMLPQVQTNLSNNDMLGLAARLAKFNISGSAGWPYQVRGGMLNGISYVFPDGLADNVTKMHKKMFGQEDYKPSATVNEISNTIVANLSSASNQKSIKTETSGTTTKKPSTGSNTKKPDTTTPSKPTKPEEPVEPDNPEPTEPTTPDEPVEDPSGGDSGSDSGTESEN